MAQFTVSLQDTTGLKTAVRGVLAAAAIGFVAWNGASGPADAVALAVAAGYGHLTAPRPAHLPAISPLPIARRGKETTERRHG